MAHHVYTTEAFVIESAPGREADKLYVLWTRELGMIRASAQGVRLLRSKLRYSLQDFSKATVSVVRGKEWWRITNAAVIDNIYARNAQKKFIIYTIARIFRLLNRLAPEAEQNIPLFDYTAQAINFLLDADISASEILGLEYIVALNILFNLGYVAVSENTKLYLNQPLTPALVSQAKSQSQELVKIINAAIRESHL